MKVYEAIERGDLVLVLRLNENEAFFVGYIEDVSFSPPDSIIIQHTYSVTFYLRESFALPSIALSSPCKWTMGIGCEDTIFYWLFTGRASNVQEKSLNIVDSPLEFDITTYDGIGLIEEGMTLAEAMGYD